MLLTPRSSATIAQRSQHLGGDEKLRPSAVAANLPIPCRTHGLLNRLCNRLSGRNVLVGDTDTNFIEFRAKRTFAPSGREPDAGIAA